MKTNEVLRKLELYGKEQNRNVYYRHGVGDNQFGVSFANLRKIAKEIGRDADLAEMLWRSGNHDARLLACMIVEEKTITRKKLDHWAQDLDNHIIADTFSDMVSRTPFARIMAEAWIVRDGEWVSAAGWNLVSYLAMKDELLPDDYFMGLLDMITATIHQKPNRTRYSMNNAIIAIGIRNPHLRGKAEEAAWKIGKVQVDHGETACRTPDAITYIEKTIKYRTAKNVQKSKISLKSTV